MCFAVVVLKWKCCELHIILYFGFSQEQNKIFSRETSFHQFSNMASSGLKKMLILIILYT